MKYFILNQYFIFTLYTLVVFPHMDIVAASEGRLKSPAIDFDHENPSIGGDFNRPADATIISISLFVQVWHY